MTPTSPQSGPIEAVIRPRQGGKTAELLAKATAILGEGWTEVTDDPSYGPPIPGVRKFKSPTGIEASIHEPDFDQLPIMLGGTHPNAPTTADIVNRHRAVAMERRQKCVERWAPAFEAAFEAVASAEVWASAPDDSWRHIGTARNLTIEPGRRRD